MLLLLVPFLLAAELRTGATEAGTKSSQQYANEAVELKRLADLSTVPSVKRRLEDKAIELLSSAAAVAETAEREKEEAAAKIAEQLAARAAEEAEAEAAETVRTEADEQRAGKEPEPAEQAGSPFHQCESGGSGDCQREIPKVLLVVSRWKEDISWLTDQTAFEYVVCPHAAAPPPRPPHAPVDDDGGGPCAVPLNKGAEASAYLLFIINEWDTLPETLVFNDASESSWHQQFDMIARLKEAVPKFEGGFFPLNNVLIDSDQANRAWRYEKFSLVWDAVVRPHLDDAPCPKRIVGDGSAQFIVSRDRIKMRPLALYKDLYAYSIGSKRWPSDKAWTDGHGFSFQPGGPTKGSRQWVGGVFFLEWIWHIIFGEPAILERYQPYADGKT